MGLLRRKARAIAILVAGISLGMLVLTPAGAHVNESFDHLWTEHIKPKFANPGAINDSNNPVHWTKLKKVPQGLADGIDHGQLLGYGLEYTQQFGLTQINSDTTQRRVTGTCGSGSAIRTINRNGSVACTAPGSTAGFSVFHDSTGEVCHGVCTEGALTPPAGTYMIWGKITLAQHAADDPDYLSALCELVASADGADPTVLDRATALLTSDDHTNSWSTITTLPFMAVASFETPRTYSIDCSDTGESDSDVDGFNLHIQAIPLGSLSRLDT